MGGSPINVAPMTISVLDAFLASNPSIQYIRYQWVDYSGHIGCRVATIPFARSLTRKSSGLQTPSPLLRVFLTDGSLLLEDADMGNDELIPDWSSLKVCHYQEKHAQVMCFWKEGGILGGKGFRRCPRTRLIEVCEDAQEKFGLGFLVGVEIEFYIMDDSKGVPEPVETAGSGYSSAGLNNKYLPILEEIVESIMNAGIDVRQFHSEGVTGCYEFSLEPLTPLQAADALIYSHETIRNICRKHGVHGTVFPKPFEKLMGLGSHHHLSISKVEKEESFLAGLLEHWRALAAFYMPTYDSCARVRGNERICWGIGNRATCIRKIKAGHWELRTIDATANPYLTMTAILTAGLLGVEKSKVLTMKDPMEFNHKGWSDEQAKELGMVDTMPTSLKAAIESLKNAKELKDRLGPELVDSYLKVKTKEEENFGKLILSERKAILMKLF